ncbi:MAG: condensation domain-containing protein, partial [Candidatus Electryoneaceae bacterium]|nr:condensation domain-containing protein [Candidatus Electryoneaceae bacterium]
SDDYAEKLRLLLSEEEYETPIITLHDLPFLTITEPLSRHIALDDTHVIPEIAQTPDDNCYILHTSGTTGEPKAIIGHHKGLSHYIHWEIGEFDIDSQCKIAIFAPPTFDVSLRDIFIPLISGGTVIVPPGDLFENATYMINWMSDNGLTHCHIVPSLFRLLLSELEQRDSVDNLFPKLKYVLLAGEPLYGRDVNRWKTLFAGRIQLVNLYGPSESTLAKCFNRLTETLYPDEKIIAVGKPISNTAILILKDNRLCSIGEIGEIHIKSPFITKGYYKDAELTSQYFVRDPLNPKRVDIIYKTGDMGRYLADRSVELLGRLDRQVKVNGNRIELGDVESSVLTHSDVTQCYASVVSNKSTIFLVCYYTGSANITTEDLRRYLVSLLPDYMVPSFYVQLDQFPLTLNGKIDKRRLPKPEEILYADKSFRPPTDEYEKNLATIWSKILGIKKIGINNPFYELGGTSLSAIKLVSEIYQAFEINLTLRDVIQNPTVAECADLIKSKLEADKISKISPLPIQDDYVISAAQRRVWFLHQLEGGDVVNNIPALLKVHGEIDIDNVEKSLNHIIQRHEALRTAFIVKDGVPVQVISDSGIKVERLELPADQDKTEFIESIFRTEVKTPFQLHQAPLMRCKIAKLDEAEYVFFLTIHHIIGDGLSLDIISQEMFTVYKAFAAGEEPDLPAISFHYKDFAHWQNEYLQSSHGLQHQKYWHDKFAEAVESIEFPTDFPRSAIQTFAGKTLNRIIPDHCYSGLDSLAKAEGVSLFTLLTTLLKTTLYRYTDQNDITLGTAIAGRNHPDLVDQVGIFVNLIALRDKVIGEQSFKSFLNDVSQTIADAMEHQSYPYDQLVNELNLERTMSRSPLFDINVTLQEDYHAFDLPSGLRFELVDMDWEMSRYDLMFTFKLSDDGLKLDIIYNSSLFTDETVALFCDHLIELAQNVIESPDTTIDLLNMLPLQEQELLDNFGQADDGSVVDGTVLDSIERFAQSNPDKLALSDGEHEITYGELSKLTDGVAHGVMGFAPAEQERSMDSISPPDLREGSKGGGIIAMILERSIDAIITQIGIMKSGHVYLPIDPKFPFERIVTMLKQSGCRHIVTDNQYYSQAKEFEVESVHRISD